MQSVKNNEITNYIVFFSAEKKTVLSIVIEQVAISCTLPLLSVHKVFFIIAISIHFTCSMTIYYDGRME